MINNLTLSENLILCFYFFYVLRLLEFAHNFSRFLFYFSRKKNTLSGQIVVKSETGYPAKLEKALSSPTLVKAFRSMVRFGERFVDCGNVL